MMDLFNIADTIKGATYHVDQIDAKEARDIVKSTIIAGRWLQIAIYILVYLEMIQVSWLALCSTGLA